MAEDVSIGFQHYDPYTEGWYLLPVDIAKVPSTVSGLTSGQISVLNAHTIQALIELVYVRVGNDVLYSGLNGLDKALSITSRTLELLSGVQEAHNALTTSTLGNFSAWFVYDSKYGSTANYQQQYGTVASAFFGIPIVPDFVFSSAGATIETANGTQSFSAFASALLALRSNLTSDLAVLSSLSSPEDISNPDSLYGATLQVLCDLPPNKNGAGITWTDAKLWTLDRYTINAGQDLAQVNPTQHIQYFKGSAGVPGWSNVVINAGNQVGMGAGYLCGGGQIPDDFKLSGGNPGVYLTFSGRLALVNHSDNDSLVTQLNPVVNGQVVNPLQSGYIGSFGARITAQDAGQFQQNITVAITAAQGLNNTQTENVRSFMFTFQEYYKSASAALTNINQLIGKFAQNIRPS